MAIKTFATGEVLTASDTNTYLANSGLVYVTSTTIGSAVSSITLSNVFNSTYDSYRVVLRGTTATNIDWLKLTLSGASGLSYAFNLPYYNYSTAGTFYYVNGGANHIGFVVTGTTMSGAMDIHNPFATATTGFYTTGASETYVNAGGGYNSNTTSSTGFTLTPNAGTITGGTVTVYGYRKA
jgi:hypothetical protein